MDKGLFEIHPCLSGRSYQQVQRLLDLLQTQDTGENTGQAAAIYAYNRDRAKDARWADTTPEQWLQLYQAAKVILPLMGAGEDTKTLYDKICTEGGY